jgi:hypothetical protein
MMNRHKRAMDGNTQVYLSTDYSTARRRFRDGAKRAGAALESLNILTVIWQL